MTSPRDTYLAWQADIGTEEVVLAKPWVRRTPVATPARSQSAAQAAAPAQAHVGPQNQPPRTRTPFETPGAGVAIPAGPEFFNAIAQELARPDSGASRGRSRPVAAAAPAPASAPTLSPLLSALSALTDLDAYWRFLDAQYPVLFPGISGTLTRAAGHASPRLALVELAPVGGSLFAGDAGVLLDRMMSAIGLTRDQLYLTSLMKTPPTGRSWARKDTAKMVPALLRELKLAQCGLVLLLGEPCAQTVLKTGRGLDALAGTAETVEDVAFAATWHPADLLADESKKKPAWEQLKWLQTRLPRRS